MTVLAKTDLEDLLTSTKAEKRLHLTPLVTEDQIGEGSIDLRLGNLFLFPQRSLSATQTYADGLERVLDPHYQTSFREFGRPVFLHPGQLVLGASFEYVAMPKRHCAYVTSRSSFGRTGLVIATATFVGPNFKGCITLEITNIGEIPLPLYPGMRIAQMVVHELTLEAEYKGRFDCPTGPMPPLLSKDREREIWLGDKSRETENDMTQRESAQTLQPGEGNCPACGQSKDSETDRGNE